MATSWWLEIDESFRMSAPGRGWVLVGVLQPCHFIVPPGEAAELEIGGALHAVRVYVNVVPTRLDAQGRQLVALEAIGPSLPPPVQNGPRPTGLRSRRVHDEVN